MPWRRPWLASWGMRAALAAAAAAAGALYAGCGDLLVSTTTPSDGGSDGTAVTTSDSDTGDATSLDGADANGANGDDAGLDADAGATTAMRALDCTGQDAAFGAPTDLGCTGLYSDWSKRTIASGAKEYDPGLTMWNDGAAQTRWVSVPPGQKIDTTDMNEWRFPVGFKAWQEIRLSGRRVETRHSWKRGESDWVRTTYRWSDDGTSATAIYEGAQNVGGTSYDIPTAAQCDQCHAGRVDKVLGFEAVSLASAKSTYDGRSPAIGAMAALLTAPPPSLAIPDDASGKAAPALAWLHANCGTSCHSASPGAFAGSIGPLLRLEIGAAGLGAYTDTNTYKTGVCRAARFTQAPSGAAWTLLRPHEDSTRSLVAFRANRRNDALVQMPPFATSIPDVRGAQLVQDWLAKGSFPAQTGAGETCP